MTPPAESELVVLARQCLDRRIPSRDVLKHETGAWQGQRNRDAIQAQWRFTTGTPESSSSPYTHQYNGCRLIALQYKEFSEQAC